MEIEPSLLGYALEAVVALTVSPGVITDMATALSTHPSARYVSTHDLAQLPGVTSFDVSIVLEALRRHWLDREDGRPAAAAPATDTPATSAHRLRPAPSTGSA